MSEILEGRNPIGSKCVLKIKQDGRYRARLVCLGYTQVPGINFQDNFAPVVNDTTFQTVLTLKAIYDWELTILYVETAFRYEDLKEDIFMELLAGIFLLGEVKEILKNKFKMNQANKRYA